jgi:hypothetical protein
MTGEASMKSLLAEIRRAMRPDACYRRLTSHRPVCAGGPTDRQINEEAALKYARWLATRDGKDVQRYRTRFEQRDEFWVRDSYRVEWGCVESKHKRRRRRPRWTGGFSAEFPAMLDRVRAVEFGTARNVYNERKDGRQGAYLYTEFVSEIRIEIPHWDFEYPPLELCEDHALGDNQPMAA